MCDLHESGPSLSHRQEFSIAGLPNHCAELQMCATKRVQVCNDYWVSQHSEYPVELGIAEALGPGTGSLITLGSGVSREGVQSPPS